MELWNVFGLIYVQVTVLKVDSDSEVFERCKTLTYEIFGSDGWMPETIIAYHHNYPPVIFNYNYFIPEGVARGFDNCGH